MGLKLLWPFFVIQTTTPYNLQLEAIMKNSFLKVKRFF